MRLTQRGLPFYDEVVRLALSPQGILNMTRRIIRIHRLFTPVCLLSLGLLISSTPSQAADVASERVTFKTVKAGKMGAYDALARLTKRSFDQGDYATAGALARILESSWDKGETDLQKNSPEIFKQIDGAMDGFIKPLTTYALRLLIDTKEMTFPPLSDPKNAELYKKSRDAFFAETTTPPDRAKVQQSFETYLGKLKLAE